MKRRKDHDLKVIDTKTGEIFDAKLALVQPDKPLAAPKQHPFGDFTAVNSNRENEKKTMAGVSLLYELRNDPDLTGECWRILWGLVFWLEWDNWITISQRRFAKEMDIKPQNLTPIFKILEAKNLLQRGQKNGSSYTFRLNPQILYKGDKSSLSVYLRRIK